MRIQEIMSAHVRWVAPALDAEEAWQVMQTNGIRHLVVKDGPGVVGILSETDAGGPHGAVARRGATVGELMDRHVVTVESDDTVRKAANLMAGHRVGCVAVFDRGRLVGIVTVSDMLHVVGGGADRPAHNARPVVNHRVAHRKAHAPTGRW